MAVYLCHEQPDLYHHEARITDRRRGALVLDRSAFHPGGGGQVADVGSITTTSGELAVTSIEVERGDDGEERWWHVLADPDLFVDDDQHVEVMIDREHRTRVASLHTASHILNAFVFDEFEGSLVTGAQINGDGTGRMDFDLSAIDNDRLRALEEPVNDVIARGVSVEAVYVDAAHAADTAGLVRSMSVAPPPTPDGRLRLIEIDGVDRQACGGTHLSNTGEASGFRMTKIENKGKRNRRVRFALP
ncbi:MAG: alanyl-tRNA editing protein [Actinomycetota bacterium]